MRSAVEIPTRKVQCKSSYVQPDAFNLKKTQSNKKKCNKNFGKFIKYVCSVSDKELKLKWKSIKHTFLPYNRAYKKIKSCDPASNTTLM